MCSQEGYSDWRGRSGRRQNGEMSSQIFFWSLCTGEAQQASPFCIGFQGSKTRTSKSTFQRQPDQSLKATTQVISPRCSFLEPCHARVFVCQFGPFKLNKRQKQTTNVQLAHAHGEGQRDATRAPNGKSSLAASNLFWLPSAGIG